ncbi:MAG: hypothetical protein ACTSWP_00015 [Candidatus Freyarchaeota archaeon]|nr:hypothetical protein [Candidatus Freyrarchaeum guaymaensis]
MFFKLEEEARSPLTGAYMGVLGCKHEKNILYIEKKVIDYFEEVCGGVEVGSETCDCFP